MKERPILFSAPMVRALLAGTKTQTRRVVKHRFPHLWNEPYYPTGKVLDNLPTQPGAFMEFRLRQQDEPSYQGSPASSLLPSPYGQPGDRLWVREAWATNEGSAGGYVYRADHGGASGVMGFDLNTGECTTRVDKWRPSIHMPRTASRILLEVTGVRVERLQEISETDAIAEGLAEMDDGRWLPGPCDHPEWAYHLLWDQINGPGSWAANPWVWVVEFKKEPA